VSVSDENFAETGCLICGKPIVYSLNARELRCEICGRSFTSNVSCEDGHYVCDKCHSSGFAEVLRMLFQSEEKDPMKLFLQVVLLPSVHMHGPEHHAIVPAVLLTAYKNCGGKLDFAAALNQAIERGSHVPGGICGFWGACGAAIGAGIYMSVLTGTTPYSVEEWSEPQRMTAHCLEKMAETGGPRCCKRTSRTAIKTAVDFTRERFGISMPVGDFPCTHFDVNEECIHTRCPYYRGEKFK